MADLPGLIEGAHQGKGLGHQFLRHIERCRVIIHVIDMGGADGRDPVEDFTVINEELRQYQYRLMERPMVVVANKMDLEDAPENLERFKKTYPDVEVFEAITLITEGLDRVLYRVADLLEVTPEFTLGEITEDRKVYTFVKEEPIFEVRKVGDGQFRLVGDIIEKRYQQADLQSDEAVMRWAMQLRKWGVDEALREAGAKDGDIIALCDSTFVFVE